MSEHRDFLGWAEGAFDARAQPPRSEAATVALDGVSSTTTFRRTRHAPLPHEFVVECLR
ncbi:MAG: hypothetical protein R3F13_06310 [Prosthecobacter sp.]